MILPPAMPHRLARPPRRRRRVWPAAAALLALAACSSAGSAGGRPFAASELTVAQKEQLAAAERAYRAGRPEFAAQREELAQNPTTAFWLTRLFVRDLLFIRENQDVGDNAMLDAAARRTNAASLRAKEQVVALGARAVPCIVEDLLKHRQGTPRELGVELIGAIGEDALQGLRPLLQNSEVNWRRSGVEALGAVAGSPTTLELLRTAAADGDFTVRAEAMRGLGHGGEGEASLLRKAMAADGDAFVRRVAAGALGAFRDRSSAEALVAYLDRCKQQHDWQGEQAAQESLKRISAGSGPRTVDAWRLWLAGWNPPPPVKG